MTKPEISVVLPTWNRASVLPNAIRSIVDQTFKGWELIVIDDGSTDGTKRIVDSFAHPQIKYHKVEHQNNISRVRNLGNALAEGEFIVVQDSDDLSFPDRLESILSAFRANPDADVVYHGMYMRFTDIYMNCMVRFVKPAQEFDRERMKREQYIPAQMAYTKKVAMEIPYNEEVPLMDDFIFLLELAYQNKNFVRLDKNLYEYVQMPDSINIIGELDGRRKEDSSTVLRILKEKYGVSGQAILTRSVMGKKVSEEIV